MANLYPLRSSFTAGELAPALWARSDLSKYNSGARILENFRVQPYGGVSKRNGTRFIQRVKSADGARCRLIPFQFSLDDSYMLEFGDLYVRFFRDGAPVLNANGTVYEVVSPYSLSDLNSLSYTQSADVLFLVCPTKRPYELARHGVLDWRFTVFNFENGPFAARTLNDEDITLSFSGDVSTTGADITATASANLFQVTHVNSLWNTVQSVDALVVRTTGGVARTTTQVSVRIEGSGTTGVTLFTVWAGSSVAPVGTRFFEGGVIYTVTSASWYDDKWMVRTSPYIPLSVWGNAGSRNLTKITSGSVVNQNWSVELMVYDTWHVVTAGFWYGDIVVEYYSVDESRWVAVARMHSENSANGARNHDITGELSVPARVRVIADPSFVQFIPSGNSENDAGYVELSRPSSLVRGIFRINTYTNATSVRATVVSPFVNSEANTNWQQGAWSNYNGYPTVVGFFEERLSFASTANEPQTIWMSKSGDYYNFGSSLPVVDDDSITRTLSSRQLNKIEAIIPLNALIIATSASEWKISGGQTGGVTPSNFTARVQGNRGSNNLEPILVNATVLFIQSKGSKVNDLIYNYETDLYQGTDLSILAPHIFEEYRVTDWAFQAEPDSMIWMVREDGLLISLTYLKEHDVAAWARHPMTNATVHAVGCLSGREKDTLYLIVYRNGIYSIETLEIVKEDSPEDCYYVDGGTTVSSDSMNINTVSGLSHLEGMDVSLLVDGNVSLANKIVRNGRVTLDYPAQYVSVGIPYTAKLETLDLGFDNKDGTQIARKAKISRAKIRVERTRGLFAQTVDGDENLIEIKDRELEGQGSPIKLYTGDIDVNLMSTFNEGRITLTAPHPLPATILAIVGATGTGGF